MCMKYPTKLIFCRYSKPSEKTACVQKGYAGILNVACAVVINVEKKVKRRNRIFSVRILGEDL